MEKRLNKIRNRSMLAFVVTTSIALLVIELCTADAPHPPPIFVDILISAILGSVGSLFYLIIEQEREFARKRTEIIRMNKIIKQLHG